MKLSLKLGRVAGIDVFLHATFGILLVWIAGSELLRAGDVRAAAVSVAFVVALFATVVLHEFGHALTARRFGIQTRDITLYPIGGVARLERMPDNPRHELLVAIAGPAVNFVIAAALFTGLVTVSSIRAPSATSFAGSFVANLAWANLAIALFNLVPAFPMDGGRALRAWLALRYDHARATRTAVRLGQGFALLFGLLGLFFNPMLLFIALFVWVAATAESHATDIKVSLEGIPVGSVMGTRIAALQPDDPVGLVANVALTGFQDDFPVVEAGHVVGVLTRTRMLEALAGGRTGTPVASLMATDFISAEPHEMLADVLVRLASCNCRSIPVVWQGQLVGLLAMDQVTELIAVRRRLREVSSPQLVGETWLPWWEDRAA